MIFASLAIVPPTNRPRRNRPPDGAAAEPTTGHAGTSRPSRRSTASVASVRSGWPAPSSASSTGVPSDRRRTSWISAATSGGGRLGDQDDELDARRRRPAAAAPPGWPARRPRRTGRGRRRPSACVTPDAGMVEQRQHLLAAGARGGDQPDRAGLDDVGEAEPEAADHRGAAVRAHHQQPLLGGRPLERDLLLDRHVVAEDHHVVAGLDRVHRLDEGVGARHRDQRDRVGGTAETRARRSSAAAPPRWVRCPGAPASASARVDPGQRRVQRAVLGQPDRDHHVVGRRLGGHVEAHLGEHLDVERGGHRDLRGGHAVEALDGAAHLEQRHRVGVGAAAELDVGCHAATLSNPASARVGRPPAARGPTCARPLRARWPSSSSACRARPATPRTPGSPRRASRSRAASPRAAWCGATRRGPPRRRPGWRCRRARCTASQPQSTSSPYGVRPSPRPDQRGHVDRDPGVPGQRQPRHLHVDEPADHQRLVVEVQHAARAPTPVATSGQPVERRCAARRAPRWRASRRRRRTGRPTSTYTASGPRCSTGAGPSPCGAQVGRARAGARSPGSPEPTLVAPRHLPRR